MWNFRVIYLIALPISNLESFTYHKFVASLWPSAYSVGPYPDLCHILFFYILWIYNEVVQWADTSNFTNVSLGITWIKGTGPQLKLIKYWIKGNFSKIFFKKVFSQIFFSFGPFFHFSAFVNFTSFYFSWFLF